MIPSEILEHLRKAAESCLSLQWLKNDFEPTPITTEYLLTALAAVEFARGFQYGIAVEKSYRKALMLANALNRNGLKRDHLGEVFKSKRCDLVVFASDSHFPKMFCEFKIGVATIKKIEKDLDRLIDAKKSLPVTHQKSCSFISVFQKSLRPTRQRQCKSSFECDFRKFEKALSSELCGYSSNRGVNRLTAKHLLSGKYRINQAFGQDHLEVDQGEWIEARPASAFYYVEV